MLHLDVLLKRLIIIADPLQLNSLDFCCMSCSMVQIFVSTSQYFFMKPLLVLILSVLLLFQYLPPYKNILKVCLLLDEAVILFFLLSTVRDHDSVIIVILWSLDLIPADKNAPWPASTKGYIPLLVVTDQRRLHLASGAQPRTTQSANVISNDHMTIDRDPFSTMLTLLPN